MTVRSIVPDGDANLITLDFSDEVLEGTSAAKCVTTARYVGDPSAYVSRLAEDFRRNNAALFPAPEIVMEPHDMLMGEQ